ncbi:helix-turn-helix transcriptional regulator [Streptomyces sp. CA-106131]|uniref:helix-turn-helix transcriptional regulator n=1 Tax=Streptomyces sp. CA-106131 TaxID=3240045 RepID=UPI003D9359DA
MINGGRTRLRTGPTSKITIYSWSTCLPKETGMTTASRRRRVPKDELLPLSDALEEIGISRATWYRWRDRGYGPEAKRTPSGRICPFSCRSWSGS